MEKNEKACNQRRLLLSLDSAPDSGSPIRAQTVCLKPAADLQHTQTHTRFLLPTAPWTSLCTIHSIKLNLLVSSRVLSWKSTLSDVTEGAKTSLRLVATPRVFFIFNRLENLAEAPTKHQFKFIWCSRN